MRPVPPTLTEGEPPARSLGRTGFRFVVLSSIGAKVLFLLLLLPFVASPVRPWVVLIFVAAIAAQLGVLWKHGRRRQPRP